MSPVVDAALRLGEAWRRFVYVCIDEVLVRMVGRKPWW